MREHDGGNHCKWRRRVEISCNWGHRVEQLGGNLLQLGAVGWNNGVEIYCNWRRRVEIY